MQLSTFHNSRQYTLYLKNRKLIINKIFVCLGHTNCFSSLDSLAPLFPECKLKNKLPPRTSQMLKNRLRFSIFCKNKMKNCSPFLKFCKNQDFFSEKVVSCVCCIKILPLSLKFSISIKK